MTLYSLSQPWNSMFLVSDWFRHGHGTQFQPMIWERKSMGFWGRVSCSEEGRGKNFLPTAADLLLCM